MVIGHLGVALGARALKRDAPLSWLVAASFAPDIVDLAVPAIETCHAPGFHSHSLPAVALLATLIALLARWQLKSWRLAGVMAALTVLHVVADYITGDKVLWFGGPIVGLDLYDWPWADLVVESCVIGTGWWMFRRAEGRLRWLRSWIALATLLSIQTIADIEIKRTRASRIDPCLVSPRQEDPL